MSQNFDDSVLDSHANVYIDLTIRYWETHSARTKTIQSSLIIFDKIRTDENRQEQAIDRYCMGSRFVAELPKLIDLRHSSHSYFSI